MIEEILLLQVQKVKKNPKTYKMQVRGTHFSSAENTTFMHVEHSFFLQVCTKTLLYSFIL